MASFVVAVLQ